ncbi:primosomal protein N' [Sporosarcina limicola]|uniref:Replication restart protein PriA n=1 Tax=Sporosarcina limicola TaxID=34101 RepID=A0A927RBL7_9BACL|nr:primosomal protein N' [Sporosarcina limicola]MBE1553515.1 primosomal protein N' (replication factor Y) [Sporosarcina limicola]
MIAEVIVDVAAYPIDRPFDYLVPASMAMVIESGSRVKVPFGPRKVLGYVTALKEESDLEFGKLKPIVELIDLEPAISEELLDLSKWLATQTLSYEIDALQVMLPAAMRAKYEKFIIVNDSERIEDLEFLRFLAGRKRIPLKEATASGVLKAVKRYVEQEVITVDTAINQKTAVKKVRMIRVVDESSLIKVLESIQPNARKQVELIQWMLGRAGQTISAKKVVELSGIQSSVLKIVIEKGAAFEELSEVYREPEGSTLKDGKIPQQLTNEQQTALQQLTISADNRKAETFLLHGVTGSGKTEVYLRAIKHVLQEGREAIVLVPEIALTPQMTARFKERFGVLVAVMHSGLSAGEKYDEWRKIRRGEVKVVVGARSAIFAPFENIGIIILDEEHESTYKQEDTPRYHARDVAIRRAEYYNCPVILGSATPSLESYARASKGVYSLLTLTKRAKNQELPAVTVVDMREELKTGNRSMFSVALADAVRLRLEKGEQTVLFLNKRGFSSFVLCRDCGTVVECPNCDISLTYHRSHEQLKCHYCGHEERVPLVCPECKSEHIRFFGTGTQKAEEEIAKLFPEARVLRMDVDTTRKKGSHERILSQFSEGKADILLGTQMIAKGLDFPNITLVGVLAADTTLHLADFRAAEKTFQLMTQVSGRAGRHELPGEVFMQTYSPEHYAIDLAKAQHYEPFYNLEMAARRQYGYPPFYFVTLIQFTHEDLLKVADFADKGARFLKGNLSPETVIIGPTAAAISRVNNRYRYQCLIKYKKEPKLTETLQQLIKYYRTDWIKSGLTMTVDIEPASIY